jgi:hypothetical protein
MLLIFTGFLLYMIAFYPILPCNCGGVVSAMTWQQHVVSNFLMIVMNGVAIVLYPKYEESRVSNPATSH